MLYRYILGVIKWKNLYQKYWKSLIKKIFLIVSVIVSVVTEGILIYENLSELGINLPFKQYFDKMNNIK